MSGEVSQAARPRKQHELKCWPQFFQPTMNAHKRFEVRKNDRDFRVGDELLLKEWDPKGEFGSPTLNTEPVGYTGRAVIARVDYILTFDDVILVCPYFPEGWIIMSISLVH